MARQRNDETRIKIMFRRDALTTEHPLTPSTKIIAMLAEEFKISPHTVYYYLRRVSKDARDGRSKYTAEERSRFATMSRKQLKHFAATNGLNFHTLYAMVWRHKAKQSADTANLEAYHQAKEAAGYLDFGNLKDLRAFGFGRNAVKEAKKALNSIQSLDILAPRYLVHPPSHKRYTLSLSEQISLLTNPKKFIAARAEHISQNWEKCDSEGHYFVLVDTRTASKEYAGTTITTHDTFERAALAQRTHKFPTAVLRRIGESRSTFARYQEGERVPRKIGI